jgi:hypothetical protein
MIAQSLRQHRPEAQDVWTRTGTEVNQVDTEFHGGSSCMPNSPGIDIVLVAHTAVLA